MDVLTDPIKRVTLNVPKRLLRDAQASTRKNMTETIIEGLRLLRRRRAYDRAMGLKGKVHLDLDMDLSRERRR